MGAGAEEAGKRAGPGGPSGAGEMGVCMCNTECTALAFSAAPFSFLPSSTPAAGPAPTFIANFCEVSFAGNDDASEGSRAAPSAAPATAAVLKRAGRGDATATGVKGVKSGPRSGAGTPTGSRRARHPSGSTARSSTDTPLSGPSSMTTSTH